MRILVAPDSFKGTLTAFRAAEFIRDALPADAAARALLLPLADGGEGTVDVLHAAWGGDCVETVVPGPLGAPVSARWLHIPRRHTAVIESASCLGPGLLDPAARDPLHAYSLGLGVLMRAVLEKHPRRLYVGVGGTATNDGGLGLAMALGWQIGSEMETDSDIGHILAAVSTVRPSALVPRGRTVVTALVDVDNPLCGPQGATAVYGPQKGVRAEDVPRLDAALGHWARMVRRSLPRLSRFSDPEAPGTGAGGGLGFGLAAFAGAELKPGATAVLRAVGFNALLRDASLVITGEGRIDAQTGRGKVVSAVAAAAARAGVPVVAIGGRVDGNTRDIAASLGLALLLEAAPRNMSDGEALRAAERTLSEAVTAHTDRILSHAR